MGGIFYDLVNGCVSKRERRNVASGIPGRAGRSVSGFLRHYFVLFNGGALSIEVCCKSMALKLGQASLWAVFQCHDPSN